jgi:hypothetical protein
MKAYVGLADEAPAATSPPCDQLSLSSRLLALLLLASTAATSSSNTLSARTRLFGCNGTLFPV